MTQDKIVEGKKILDACCGSRMFWFDKTNKDVLFVDIRSGDFNASNGTTIAVQPDMVVDFRDMPFPDNSFKMVVFDPPHRSDLTENNWMHHTYGRLLPTWETDIRRGFDECMRVLEPNGTLIFKWNEKQISTKRILSLLPVQPLYGHTSSKNTIWMAFMKFPETSNHQTK
jgi:ubiquinone/menaquinone biosynthesis C-methylase UbiE